ncbi:MAG: esterase-like activity of phytase family protein [Acidimicrobiia bacterium]
MRIVQTRNRLALTVVVALLLGLVALPAVAKPPTDGQVTVDQMEFIGATEFETGYLFHDTEVGGLSGIVYDKWNGVFHALSDDKSETNDARFYSLTIDLDDGYLDDGDVEFVDVTFLTDANGDRFVLDSLDPEGFEMMKKGHLFIGSERDLENQPWIKRFGMNGMENMTLPLPEYFLASGDPQDSGVYLNLAFESLTSTPNGRFLYAATEAALTQDGLPSTLDDGSPARVLEFSVNGNKMNHLAADSEYVYMVEPIPFQEPGRFADQGLVEMQAIDNFGTFLTMERSFASGIGNTIQIFETSILGATDVSGVADLDDTVYTPMSKRLVAFITEADYDLDNMEGMAFGPKMKDGRIPLIIVADNNFNSPFQRTVFLAYALDLAKVK